MDLNTILPEVRKAIDASQNILLITHERPTHDSIGSTLCLYLGLVSLGKNVMVVCPDPVTVEFSDYVGINKVVSDVARKNFIISLDYVEGSIEKVSYNIAGEKFNLVIEPRPGFPPFSEDKVHFTRAGLNADLVIAVDTIHPGGYRAITQGSEADLAGKPLLNIDHHPNNANYGTVNCVDDQAAATCEVVASVLSVLGVKLNPDLATNMINALFHGTDNFRSPKVSGRTFELASACIKAGGKRIAVAPPDNKKAVPVSTPVAEAVPQAENIPETPPSDWLKPKIFRSSQNS